MDVMRKTEMTQIKPILEEFCYDCHGDESNKGKVELDRYPSHEAFLQDVKRGLEEVSEDTALE